MKKKTVATIVGSAAVGVGVGMLLAPKSGKETREDLKNKIIDLKNKVKNIKVEDVKSYVEEKIATIEKELKELDKEKVMKIAKEKAKKIEKDCKDLAKYVKDKSEPVLIDAVEAVREKAIDVTKDVLVKLEGK